MEIKIYRISEKEVTKIYKFGIGGGVWEGEFFPKI
jgi:hypothetical protein